MLPALMIVLCVALRVIPHPPNFAPVGATAVFAGRTLPPWLAIGLTWVAMLLGDLALSRIHGYPFFTSVTPFVYGGFAVQALFGHVLRRRRGGAVGAATLGATAFFVLSNFGVGRRLVWTYLVRPNGVLRRSRSLLRSHAGR